MPDEPGVAVIQQISPADLLVAKAEEADARKAAAAKAAAAAASQGPRPPVPAIPQAAAAPPPNKPDIDDKYLRQIGVSLPYPNQYSDAPGAMNTATSGVEFTRPLRILRSSRDMLPLQNVLQNRRQERVR